MVVVKDRLPPIPFDSPVPTGATLHRILALARKLEVYKVVIGLDHEALHPLRGGIDALERANNPPLGELEKVFHILHSKEI
tara:strand:+ start:114 stop:356 length:243 start_codon:yes stop_codon:yes gene_type:complete